MKAAEIKDDSYQVWNNYGVYYAMTGDWKKAEDSFMKAGDLGANVNYNMIDYNKPASEKDLSNEAEQADDAIFVE